MYHDRCLPCGHTLCNECITAIKKLNKENTVSCPACRTKFPMTTKIPKNYTIIELMEEGEKRKEEPPTSIHYGRFPQGIIFPSFLSEYTKYPKTEPSKYRRKYITKRDNRKYLPLPQSEDNWKSKLSLLEGIYKTQIVDKKNIYLAIHSLTQYTYPHLDLGGLSHFLNTLTEDEVTLLGVRILPRIAQYASLVVEYFPYNIYPNGLPILTQGTNDTLYIGKLQIATLLACSFFCLFRDYTPGCLLPALNMNALFVPPILDSNQIMITQKLHSILFGYFRYLVNNPPADEDIPLLIRRQSNGSSKYNPDFWSQFPKQLQDVCEVGEGQMKELCRSAVMVDSSSQYLGGGVLGSGGRQEEIMFVNHPELIVARFVCESMRDEEAIYIEGANRYIINFGNADTFEYIGQSEDYPMIAVIAIDALHFVIDRDIISQFSRTNIDRELNKALAGFGNGESTPQKYLPICTGRWGCGALNGNPQLKFIIQWLATSYYQRQLYFFTQDHKDLRDLQEVCERLRPHLTISTLYKQLITYSQKFMSMYEHAGLVSNIPEYGNGLFKYLLSTDDYVFPPAIKPYLAPKPLHLMEEEKKDLEYMEYIAGYIPDIAFPLHMMEEKKDLGYVGDKEDPAKHIYSGPPAEEFKTKLVYISDNPVKKGKFFKLPTQNPKWKMIEYQLALMHQGVELKDFLKGIKEINNLVYPKDHVFSTIFLQAYLKSLSNADKNTFRQGILPKIAELASRRNIGHCFPSHGYPKGIPIIPSGHSGEIILNKQQVGCLMSCCFFGLFTPNLGDGFCVRPNFIELFGRDEKLKVGDSVGILLDGLM